MSAIVLALSIAVVFLVPVFACFRLGQHSFRRATISAFTSLMILIVTALLGTGLPPQSTYPIVSVLIACTGVMTGVIAAFNPFRK